MLIKRKQVVATMEGGVLPTADPGLDGNGIQIPWTGAIPFDLGTQYTLLLTANTTLDWRRVPAPVLGVTSRIEISQDGLGPWTLTTWGAAITSTIGSYDASAGLSILSLSCTDATPAAETWREVWSAGLVVPDREQLIVVTRDVIPDLSTAPTEASSVKLWVNGNCLFPGITPGLTFVPSQSFTWAPATAGYSIMPNDLLVAEYI